MSYEQHFHARVRWATRLYFDHLLPRYIDAHFRGAGYAFVYALLADHDVATLLRTLEDAHQPTAMARDMSRGAESMVRIDVVPDRVDPPLLGLFTRTDTFDSMGGVDFKERGSDFSVILFMPEFERFADDPELLDGEILHTLFHEMVHYFESFLPASQRPLAMREQGVEVHLTPEQARRWDTYVLVKRYVGWALVVMGILAVSIAVAWSMA